MIVKLHIDFKKIYPKHKSGILFDDKEFPSVIIIGNRWAFVNQDGEIEINHTWDTGMIGVV